MTDNDIIKALECCRTSACSRCIRLMNGCREASCCRIGVLNDAIDLINRQKAEIERLQTVEYVIPARHCGRTQFIRLYIKDIEKKAIQEFWNQRPPHLNPEFKGKEQYNKGWNDCLALFTEEYEIFLGVKNRKAETVGERE